MQIKTNWACFLLAGLITATCGIGVRKSGACTSIAWKTKLGEITGRTMDWYTSTEARIYVFPAGIRRDGGKLLGRRIVQGREVHWTSKYGSMVVSVYGMGAVDGVNSRGLSISANYFDSDYGKRNPKIKGLQVGLWVQYLLDQAGSVKEAVTLMRNIQLVDFTARGKRSHLHLHIVGPRGNCAVLEYVHGKMHAYQSPAYDVLTNAPAFPEQLKNLKRFNFTHPNRDMPLPGNVNPLDRFVRASYYVHMLPQPASSIQAVLEMNSVLNNVAVPIGEPYQAMEGFNTYNTEYKVIADLKTHEYYFKFTTMPFMIWARLTAFDLKPGAPVLELNPENPELHGNVAGRFHKVAIDKVPF